MTIESHEVAVINRLAVAITLLALPVLAIAQDTTTNGVRVFLSALILAFVPLVSVRRDGWRAVAGSASAGVSVVLAAGTFLALAFNPSSEGALFGVVAVAAVGLAASVASYSVEDVRRFVAWPLLAVTSTQLVLIVMQTATGSAIGARIFRPGAVLLVTNNDVVRPQGAYLHVYIAAAFALLCLAIGVAVMPTSGRVHPLYLGGLACASATIALTHSRSALVGFAVLVAMAAWVAVRRNRNRLFPVIVIVIAFVIPAVATADGWMARIDDSLAGDLDASSLGRVTLMRQAVALAGSSPIVGVGPRLYMDALEDQDLVDERLPYKVNNVPLLAAAELGIPVAVAIVGLAVYAALQAWRAGALASIAYWSIVSMSVFDKMFYDQQNGVLLLGIWGGVCAVLLRRDGQGDTG